MTKPKLPNGHTLLFATLDFLGMSDEFINRLAAAGYTGVRTAIDTTTRHEKAAEIQAMIEKCKAAGITDIGLIPFWSLALFGDPNALVGDNLDACVDRMVADIDFSLNVLGSKTAEGPAPEPWQATNSKTNVAVSSDDEFESVLPHIVAVMVDALKQRPNFTWCLEFLSPWENRHVTTYERARCVADAANHQLDRTAVDVLTDSAHTFNLANSTFAQHKDDLVDNYADMGAKVAHLSAPGTLSADGKSGGGGRTELLTHPRWAEMESYAKLLLAQQGIKIVVEIFPEDDFLKDTIDVDGLDAETLIRAHEEVADKLRSLAGVA